MCTIALIDDDKVFSHLFYKTIKKLYGLEVELYPKFSKELFLSSNFELIFVDINLNGQSGIYEVSQLMEQGINKVVVFISGEYILYNNLCHYFNAFFISKDHLEDSLLYLMDLDLIKNLLKPNNILIGKDVYDLQKILYIECLGKKVLIVYNSGEQYVQQETMKSILFKIQRYGFVRVHHSYIVNISSIISRVKNELLCSQEVRIPIGLKYKDEIKRLGI